MNRSIPASYSKINPSNPQRAKPQRPPRRPRPHGKPQPGRYRPPSRPRPARYALDVGKQISLEITLTRYNVPPNALTLTKIGGER